MFGFPQNFLLPVSLLQEMVLSDFLTGLLLLGSLQLDLQLFLLQGSLGIPLDQLADLGLQGLGAVIHGDGE